MKRSIFSTAALVLTAAFTFTSCEEEREVALAMSGVWETTDALFTRSYKGQLLSPVKTVFQFDHDYDGASIGHGVAIEYYDNKDLPVVYYHIKWETWTRKEGGVGIEVKYEDYNGTGHDIFKTTDYSLNDNDFNGECTINDVPGTRPFSFHRGQAVDVSNVKFWGYNELIPTWHQVTYEGNIYIKREYQGQVYYPKSVTITFDVEPAYNESMVSSDPAFIKEEYDDAPWGTYLADTIKFWQLWKPLNNLYLYRSEDYDGYHADYELQNVVCTEDEIRGEMFVRTNVFEPFTLRRVANPDWSAIKEWGFGKWFPKNSE